MLEGKDYRVLDSVFPIVAALSEQITGHHRAAPVTRFPIRYIVIRADITTDMGQWV